MRGFVNAYMCIYERNRCILKLGILGGTFNPIHLGHIYIAKEAIKELGLYRVMFIPANIPPHKEIEFNVSSDIRYNIMCKALDKYEDFFVTDIEIKRQDVSFTIDSLKELSQKYKRDEFHLIIGIDQLIEFQTWKEYEMIFDYAKLVVFKRKDVVLTEDYKQKFLDKFLDKIIFMNNDFIDISSTEIRDRVKHGQDIANLVTKEIVEDVKIQYKS